ncbi:hypothetical protein BJV74DRAFT_60212 [Russula compacta]|nr:hypothetical protein BJV74DRAFT_60212 [Russula compacta]
MPPERRNHVFKVSSLEDGRSIIAKSQCVSLLFSPFRALSSLVRLGPAFVELLFLARSIFLFLRLGTYDLRTTVHGVSSFLSQFCSRFKESFSSISLVIKTQDDHPTLAPTILATAATGLLALLSGALISDSTQSHTHPPSFIQIPLRPHSSRPLLAHFPYLFGGAQIGQVVQQHLSTTRTSGLALGAIRDTKLHDLHLTLPPHLRQLLHQLSLLSTFFCPDKPTK